MKNFDVAFAFFSFCVAFASAGLISPSEKSNENFRKLAVANNELAFSLHRSFVSESSGNVFFSPLSISTAFGMLFYGARGETAEELRRALGYEKAALLNDIVHDTFSNYFSEVLKKGDSEDGYDLNSANSILADKHFELLKDYRHNVQDLYKAVVRNVDFSMDAPKIMEEINSWVNEKTNGKIEKFLEELSPATVLIILNAVYFKGIWKTQFEPEKTRDQVFYNNGLESEAKKVPMMHMKSFFLFAFFEGFQALELPYKGENVSMLILLPDQQDGLQALEQSLTHEKITEIQSRLRPKEVVVSLPKFKLEFEKELSKDMQNIGAKKIFSSGADFSGMTPSGSMSVSAVVHKAVIEVNEEGSEAAAVTRIGMVKGLTFREEFKADHPFLFAIVEKGSQSNMILFLGRVNNM